MPVSDDYKMPFGKHIGEPIGHVPAEYLDYLSDQPWIDEWPQVDQYIRENRQHIDRELDDE